MQIELPLTSSLWIEIHDGDLRLRELYNRHYSAYHYRDGRKPKKTVGPGEYMALITRRLMQFSFGGSFEIIVPDKPESTARFSEMRDYGYHPTLSGRQWNELVNDGQAKDFIPMSETMQYAR